MSFQRRQQQHRQAHEYLYQEEQQRGVRFDRNVSVHLVPIHTEFTQHERASLWLGPEDLDDVQRDVRRTVRIMRRRNRSDPTGTSSSSSSSSEVASSSSCCPRGLEHLQSSEHMEQRRIIRDCHFSAVLGEQRRQRDELGLLTDDAALAEASARGSRWSRDLAREDGVRDMAEARKIVEADTRRAAAHRSARSAQVQRRCRPDDNGMDVLEKAMELCNSGQVRGAPKKTAQETTTTSTMANVIDKVQTLESSPASEKAAVKIAATAAPRSPLGRATSSLPAIATKRRQQPKSPAAVGGTQQQRRANGGGAAAAPRRVR